MLPNHCKCALKKYVIKMENKVSVKVLKVVLTARCMVSDEDGLRSLKGSFH